MAIQVRCGKQMDGSGPSHVFSSPNYGGVKLINPVATDGSPGDDRLPLPPGHPTSWGLLTLGTVLDGSAYADTL
jgi:hypothetical protein